ncbi:MAG: radical SAM protein [Pedobacter sp.]|nr:MAG: radical SAM protein [Pedobacter sp.]
MSKIRISAVSYTNTKPFIYGIEQSDIIHKIDLSLDIPADCAAKLIADQVDIGLIPVAAIPNVPGANIIGDYCIGSVGAVNSVFIFSDVPISQIKTVKLDPQSRTSNNLAKVLMKFYWKKEVVYLSDPDAQADALVLIGDRTFGKQTQYAFSYDMGQEWMNFTSLPFVYAAWVANKTIPEAFVGEFNSALAFGLANRHLVLKELPQRTDIDLEDYLLHKLDFELTNDKRRALELFLNYITQL